MKTVRKTDEVYRCVVCGDPSPDQSAPHRGRCSCYEIGLLEQATNFAASAAKHVAAGMPMASDDEIIRRHDICQGCEFFANNTCGKCGCPVNRNRNYVSKLSWADSKCPVGKW